MAPDFHLREKMRHSPTIERPGPSESVIFRIVMSDRCWRNREDENFVRAIGRCAEAHEGASLRSPRGPGWNVWAICGGPGDGAATGSLPPRTEVHS